MNTPDTSDSPPVADQTRWFTEEVHPHGAQLKSYLRSSFPSVRDVEDVVQESYLRVWKSKTAQRVRSAKAFLFRVATNIAIDGLRRNRAAPVQLVVEPALPDVMDGRPGVVDLVCSREEVELFARAIDTLPGRCREIVILRKLQGLSQQDIATRLRISVNTVEVQLVRGMKRCDDYLKERGIDRSRAS